MQITDIVHDKAKQQFYLTADGHKAFIDYRMENGRYQLLHSEVPSALRGQGIGKVLVEKTFAAIEAEGKTATAICSYIRHVAKRSGQWDDTVSY
ncbi:MAG TPA: GNAT family N-acetyltransferase [Woeseiaceae bacterium]|nr:GNAT family N-acetyltransferase [Woeseiaceae bacterium]